MPMPHRRDPVAGPPRSPRARVAARPGSVGRGAGFPARRGGPELVFAAVRPGFVAACMVEAAGTRGGCRIRVGRPERPPPHCWTVGRDGRGAGSTRPVKRVNGVLRPSGRALRYRTHRNRQMELLTQVAASLRGGVRRSAAITARERADAEDLVLTTLSSRVCVQSNIFGFVMT